MVALLGLGLGLASARAQAASSVAFALPAEAVQDSPYTFTVSGHSDDAASVWVLRTEESSCPIVPGREQDKWLTSASDRAVHGAFSLSYSFTPRKSTTFRLCAYLGPDAHNTAQIVAAETVTPRAPRIDVAINVTAPAIQGFPVEIAVTGSSELARTLWVRLRTKCDSTSAWDGPGEDLGEKHAVHGAFSHRFSFVPQYSGSYTVCAHLSEGTTGPRTTFSANVDVGHARALPSSPASGVTGTLLNPVFSWATPLGTYGTLVIARASKGAYRTHLAVNSSRYAWMGDRNASAPAAIDKVLEKGDGKTRDVAVFGQANGQYNVKLADPLLPGQYVWYVISGSIGRASEWVYTETERRTFTVHGPTLQKLQARTRSRAGKSTKYPGETRIGMAVTPYATVRLELRRGGQKSVHSFSAGKSSSVTHVVEWSCRKPGGRYRYRVEASDSHGKRKVTTGSFRPVSAARCRSLRAKEQRAKNARQREVRRRVAERRRAEAAAQQQRIDRYKSNCRKLGGTPELIHTGGSSYWVCVAPWGGALYVPY